MKGKSWNYQKNRYKQVSLKFFIESDDDMLLYHYLSKFGNRSKFIKELIRNQMWEDAYNGD